MSDEDNVPPSTAPGGKPVDPVEKLADPALAALRNAQKTVKVPGSSALPGRQRRRRRRDDDTTRRRGGYSAAGPDPRDPQRVGDVLSGYTADRGWQQPLAEARVFAEWDKLVGPDIAAHCAPTSLRDGELKVAAESTAWATQLRLLASSVLARLAGELGPTVVSKIVFSGPTGPSWKKGPWSMSGGRGPRDTYG